MIERSLLKTRKKQHFYFYAREKNRKVLNLLSSFQAHKKEAHPDLNSLSHFNAREKKTRKSLTRFLVFKLMKKRSTGPEKKTRKGLDSLSCFQAHEKKTRKGLFFNLRLRKASKPLREHV